MKTKLHEKIVSIADENPIDPSSYLDMSFDQDENEDQQMLSEVKKSVKLKQKLKKKRKRNVDFYDIKDENDETLETALQEKIKCYFCDEFFSKQKRLKEHAQKHINEDGNFSCKDCEKKLPTYKKLVHHNLNQHTSYTCVKCQKVLPGKQVYENHRKACHIDKSIKLFKCDQVILVSNFSSVNYEKN